MLSIWNNKKIFVFGTGQNAKKITSIFMKNNLEQLINMYIDNDKNKCKQKFFGKKVVSPNNMQKYIGEDALILLSMDKFQDVEKQLLCMGISKDILVTYDAFLDLWSVENIYRLKNKNRQQCGEIRVGFVVQEIQSWGKVAPVYEAMLSNTDFAPILIVVPSFDFTKYELTESSQLNEFKKKYMDEDVYLWGQGMDIDDYDLDYIFLPAPYDAYMPKELKSTVLITSSLLCYIPYGYIGADNFLDCNTEKAFFRNIYINFVHTDKLYTAFNEKFHDDVEQGTRIIKKIGYLPFAEGDSGRLRCDSNNIILWTPRWSYDPILGGSNFFEYKDFISSIQKLYPNYQLVVRPHPMMFENFINKGMMTPQDVAEYKLRLKQEKIILDEGTELEEIAKKTAILITDFSTIIPDFFIKGCPIIYCNSPIIQLNKEYKHMITGCYIAEDTNGIHESLERIIHNDDPLQTLRIKICHEMLVDVKGSINDCLNVIKEDYYH